MKFKYYFEDVSSFSVPEYEDFIFSNGSVQEGRRDAHSYTDFEEYSGEEESEHAAVPKKKNTIIKKELKLDRTGSAKFSIPEIPEKTSIQTLVTEMEYKDPNGEIQTIMKGSSIYPSDILVGIRDEGWSSSEKVKAEAAVLNLKRQPMSNVDVEILIYKKENYSYRRRLVGGFYAYDNFSEVKPAGVFCSGKTNANGIFSCEKSIPVKGTVYLAAKAKGKQGTDVYANKEIWIAGDDDYWFDAHNSDRMDIIPDRKEYRPGDTAKIQVKAPFQKFKALVTTEREGIMDAFIVDLTGKNPVAEVPVKGNHAPNVFVSVFAVRGRTADPKPTALVDLGKPSYKLGITQLNVDRQKHELTVKVSSDRENYKARETVRAKVKVSPKSGSGRIEKGEIAVAVVDEGLLDLKPNETWKVLENMLKTRSLTVQTSTAQMQVIGRRHFGRKAIAPGGGGGKDSTRELFDTLVYWKSVISLNSEGEAEFSFPLNDSMTSFRIVALAGADSDKFGTGYTSIKSSKDLMLISGLPTLMREGDTYYPEVTVRNTTASEKEVTVSGKLVKPEISLEEKKFRLGAGESKEVFWKLDIPVSADKLTYEISAVSGNEQDKIRITQKVGASVPVSVIQGTLRQVDREMEMPVEFPKDAVPGRGGIQVNLSPSLLDSVSGVKDYMRHYSYTCMEQEISKSISLEDRERWNRVIQKMPAYLDRDGLLKYFPNMEDGSVILTSYALSISNEAGLEIPEFSREKMTAALEGFVNGTLSRKSHLSAADLTLQKLSAIEALSRYGKAVPAMLEPLHFQVQLLPTSSVLDYFNVLNRLEVSDRAAKIKSAEQVLLARMNMQGSTMKFTSEANDSLWWLMVSPDVNAVRLILSMTGAGKWKDNMGRIMRGVLSRQKKGSWDITTANAWGVLAVKKFASEYEREPVGGNTSVSLFDSTTSADWKEKPKGSVINAGWKEKPDTLKISHTGSGKPWAVIYSRAAVPLKESVSNGYTVKKTMIPLEVKNPGKWTRGDICRVQLKVKADSDMTWVVISDPIPAGASILTGGLRKTSAVEGEKTDYNVYPAYEERSYEAYRIYYEYVPEGEFTVEYTVRLNQEGKFTVPQTRIEAMYSPDMNGETPNGQMDVSRE
ncbi:MAG TPA: alpha-2-macroglobulin family protein [Leptospiraceae bacterium]|nr:alpha-2-macroglobulin family protein [Leptospiraceae bacterium]